MVLILSSEQISAISAHAERVYPEECCGLMVGEISQEISPEGQQSAPPVKNLVQLVPLDNEWTPDVLPTEAIAEQSFSKARRYWIDPADMLRVQKQSREDDLNIIGIYHSHPDHVAVPSECDRALAWPTYAYVIVSVCDGQAVDVQNWALDSDHQFQPEVIEVSPSTGMPSEGFPSATDRMPVSA